jgi:hypothetical protein
VANLGPLGPAPDAKGTFYCQAGDHIVDSVVWLETITLGCRPCMENLGRHIATDIWTPRLWSVGPEGIRRAADIPRPDLTPEKPTERPTETPRKSKSPLRGSPREYVKEHQDWTCSVCHRSDDTMSGYYNTATGYTCKRCTPTMLNKEQREQNYQTYIERRDALEHKRETEHARKERAESTARSITRQGSDSALELEEVLPGQRVTNQGAYSRITIRGDVGEGATVIAQGGDCRIVVKGHIHKNATVVAQGGNASIQFNTRDPDSRVEAQGGGSSVQGRSTTVLPSTVSASLEKKLREFDTKMAAIKQEHARKELARTYGMEYNHPWVEAKLKMAEDVENLRERVWVCNCVRCGKWDSALGGDVDSHANHMCEDCRTSVRAVQYPPHRRALLSTIHNLETVIDRKCRPEEGNSGDWVYCMREDQLFTWVENQRPGFGWVQVSLLSAAKEKDHDHVWVQKHGDPRVFCSLCGAWHEF